MEEAPGMEVYEKGEGEREGYLTRQSELIRTMIIEARNGFNDLSRLEMMCTVRNC